jgi:hypothetical protein
VRQVELDVGEGAQELGVEARGAFVAFPAVAGLDQLVDALLGQRRDQPGQVAFVLGDRVLLPERTDRVVLGRIDFPAEQLDDGVVLRCSHAATIPAWRFAARRY